MAKRVIKASKIGFCPGVKKAIESTKKASAAGTVSTLGMLVHNALVVGELEPLGIKAVKTLGDVSGNVAITAHGVAPQVYEEIRRRDLKLLDTTCSFVKKAQQKAAHLGKEGFFVLVYGDPNHAEVKGILGWAGPNSAAVTSPSEVCGKLPKRLAILAQTTRLPSDFHDFIRQVSSPIEKFEEIRVFMTICPHVVRRANEAALLASDCDLVVVVGDPASANTNRLAEMCKKIGRAIMVPSSEALDSFPELKDARTVGVISGTSTPDRVIDEVVQAIQRME
ncbi:MAG: 4-hydroxy-3-methylbut-2-enyl diphosphate reductase [Chloroflexi bacterium]|nr:4-hydroxy-3-methylbut-2-enyl diphosphate reductase [Chloroflexota bacterium]